MSLEDNLRIAIDTLIRHKLRSTLTMLGIVIGNASIITIIGIGQGIKKLASEQLDFLGPNTLFVVPDLHEQQKIAFQLPKTLVIEDANKILSEIRRITKVAPRINRNEFVSYHNKNAVFFIIGTTSELLEIRKLKVDQGRFLNDLDLKFNQKVAVIGSEVAEKFFNNKSPINEFIWIKNIRFEVVGVMTEKGYVLGANQDDIIFIPIGIMANQIVGENSPYGIPVNSIAMAARDQDSIETAKAQTETLLRERHQITDQDDFSVQTQEEVIVLVNNITEGLIITSVAIAAISLLVGGVGIINIMLASVTERTQEIGLRKALGASERDIFSQFLIEALILSLFGGILGTAIGVGGIFLVCALTPIPSFITALEIVAVVGVSGVIGLFSGVIPAQKAAAMNPIAALRSCQRGL